MSFVNPALRVRLSVTPVSKKVTPVTPAAAALVSRVADKCLAEEPLMFSRLVIQANGWKMIQFHTHLKVLNLEKFQFL